MIHHSNVSLDYLEDRLRANADIRVRDAETGRLSSLQRLTLRRWRSQGLAYAPPCDNVTPDGRCAGHRKED